MEGLIELLYLAGIVLIGFAIYTVFCYIKRYKFARKWKNLDVFCKNNGYVYNGRAQHETDYIKEVSRDELQALFDSFNIDCVLPHDVRYFDNMAVTSVKSYTRRDEIPGYLEYVEHRGGDRTHRFLTIQWLENGKWMHFSGRSRFPNKPYIDADFGGMSNQIYPTDSQETISDKLRYELREVLKSFMESDIKRWQQEHDKK